MNKTKPQIKIKHLSWEKKSFYVCDYKSCKKEGKYKAPRSKTDLKKYYFFCLEHIKEYNKSWDFYKGMSVDEIEFSLRQDVIWNRPTWPINNPSKRFFKMVNDIIYNRFDLLNQKEKNRYNFENSSKSVIFNEEEERGLEKLDLKPPITLEKIKFSYKKLVKKYHPDINKSDKNAEKHFKEINSAYKTLLKKFLVKTN